LFFNILWARTGFDLNWIGILQVGVASGSLKRCKNLHGNKSRIKAFAFKKRELALAA
jgi:hypothetical protein